MEGVLAIILIFGGGTAIALSLSPVGRALADRIRGGGPAAETDPHLLAEVQQLRAEVSELHERLDFAERLLTKGRELSAPNGSAG